MTAEAWIDRFCSSLGVEPPSSAEVETLLALAGVAAHASERRAAPIACWLCARAGIDPASALAAAREVGLGGGEGA